MSRRRDKPRREPAVALDHGPALRLARGDTELVDGADPDAPARTVRRAEVRCLYHVVWGLELITDDQHEAADRLLVACEAESGAKDRGPLGLHVRRAPWDVGVPDARRRQAASDLMAAKAALGPGCFEATLSAVCSEWPLEWGGACPEDHEGRPRWELLSKTQLAHLRASLDILVQVWLISA